jgi:hypothetical protein
MGEKDKKSEKGLVIFVDSEMSNFAEQLSPFFTSLRIRRKTCSDIFDTIVTIINSHEDTGKFVCINAEDIIGYTNSFFAKLCKYSVKCCCLDEKNRIKSDLKFENVIITKSKKEFEKQLRVLFSDYFDESVKSDIHSNNNIESSDFTPSKDEIKALFQDSDF